MRNEFPAKGLGLGFLKNYSPLTLSTPMTCTRLFHWANDMFTRQ